MKELCVNLYTRAVCRRKALARTLREERGAVDIVAIVVMIGIAVALAVVFRKQIGDLIENLIDQTIKPKAQHAIGD